MKIPNSGKYICKIGYHITTDTEGKEEDVSSLLEEEWYVVCTIHTRRGKIWFHDVEKCANHLLEYFKLYQPFFDKKNPAEEEYDCFSGFLYTYDDSKDVYECKNQILKNTGGNKWDIYLKAYKPFS